MNSKQTTFANGLSHAVGGWRLIRQAGVKRYVWLPITINLLVFAGLGWFMFGQFDQWMSSLSWLERFQDWWIIRMLTAILQGLTILLLVLIFSFSFSILANLLAAPFNGLLSERVENYLNGTPSDESSTVMELIRSLPGTVFSEIRKLLYLAFWLIPIFLLYFIPVINIAAPFLLFGFGIWMYALEYMDYPLGNHGHNFKQVRRLLRKNRMAALGFGLPIAFLMTIPLINLFVMPAAVAAATSFYVQHLKEQT